MGWEEGRNGWTKREEEERELIKCYDVYMESHTFYDRPKQAKKGMRNREVRIELTISKE